jgi:hypothetical protein
MTIFVAICAVFILPDFPHNTRWLTPEERALAISRLAEDNNGTTGKENRTTIEGLRDAVTDWKVWWFAAVFLAQVLAQSFYLYFPTLSATMGYDTTTTLLLCAPPWVFCTICAFAVSRSVMGFYLCFVSHGRSGTLIRSKSVTDTSLLSTHSPPWDSSYPSVR